MIIKNKHEDSVIKRTAFSKAIHVMMTQMSAKKGIKNFGEVTVAAMIRN